MHLGFIIVHKKNYSKKKTFWSWGYSSHFRVLDYHAWSPELDSQYHTCWVWWSMPVMEGKTDHLHSHSKFQFPTILGRQGPLETWAHPPLPILGSLQSHLKTIVRNWAGEVRQLPRTATWFPALLLGHSQSQGTQVQGNPVPSSGLHWYQVCSWYLHTSSQKHSYA